MRSFELTIRGKIQFGSSHGREKEKIWKKGTKGKKQKRRCLGANDHDYDHEPFTAISVYRPHAMPERGLLDNGLNHLHY